MIVIIFSPCVYKAQSYKIWDKIFQLLHVFTSFNLQYNPFVHNGNITWIIMIHLFDISVFINLFSYFLNFNLRAAPWNIFGLVPFLINSMLILQNSLTTEKIQTYKRWWKDNCFISTKTLSQDLLHSCLSYQHSNY